MLQPFALRPFSPSPFAPSALRPFSPSPPDMPRCPSARCQAPGRGAPGAASALRPLAAWAAPPHGVGSFVSTQRGRRDVTPPWAHRHPAVRPCRLWLPLLQRLHLTPAAAAAAAPDPAPPPAPPSTCTGDNARRSKTVKQASGTAFKAVRQVGPRHTATFASRRHARSYPLRHKQTPPATPSHGTHPPRPVLDTRVRQSVGPTPAATPAAHTLYTCGTCCAHRPTHHPRPVLNTFASKCMTRLTQLTSTRRPYGTVPEHNNPPPTTAHQYTISSLHPPSSPGLGHVCVEVNDHCVEALERGPVRDGQERHARLAALAAGCGLRGVWVKVGVG